MMGSKESTIIFEMQAEFCRAMSSALRLEIVHLLREAPMQVNELAEATGQPQPTISRNLNKLRRAGVVAGHRIGHGVWYGIANPKISKVCDLMRQVLLEEAQLRSELLQTINDESPE
jgi:DNA-binding transcriptional ArsR family regulator